MPCSMEDETFKVSWNDECFADKREQRKSRPGRLPVHVSLQAFEIQEHQIRVVRQLLHLIGEHRAGGVEGRVMLYVGSPRGSPLISKGARQGQPQGLPLQLVRLFENE